MKNQDQNKSIDPATQGGKKIDLEAGRRAFIRTAGLGAAGAAIFGASAGLSTPAQAADLDVQILNFALNLEYLEAEFYLVAATGKRLGNSDISGTGTQGGVSGGRKVNFTSKIVADYANEIANDELTHVRFLRSALGNAKVAMPGVNIGTAFTGAAQAAKLIGPGEEFDAYKNDENFLLAAYIFEDVGVTAYKGAAPLITNKDYLGAAAGILAVEAYHAGLIRTLLFGMGAFKQTALISTLRNYLTDSSANTDQGVGADQSTLAGGASTLSNIVPTDANGLAFSRTPRQVLNIVQGARNSTKGLFFPHGAESPFNVAAK